MNLILGCRDCSGAVRPIPTSLLGVQLLLCLSAGAIYALSVRLDSTRLLPLALGLNALAFGGLLVATAHGIVAKAEFCPSCLVTWAGLGASLMISSASYPIVRWWVPVVLAGCFSLRWTTQGVGDSALLLQENISKGLGQAGFNYVLPRTSLHRGDALASAMGKASGWAVFLTKCSPCSRKVMEKALAQKGIAPEAITLVAPEPSSEWQTPTGFEKSPKILDERAWSQAGILPYGPPSLIRVANGKVEEVVF